MSKGRSGDVEPAERCEMCRTIVRADALLLLYGFRSHFFFRCCVSCWQLVRETSGLLPVSIMKPRAHENSKAVLEVRNVTGNVRVSRPRRQTAQADRQAQRTILLEYGRGRVADWLRIRCFCAALWDVGSMSL